MDLISISKFSHIDLRSEHEFHKSTIPNSKNIPILNDTEFERVGKKYKEKGQESAIDLGLKIVSGKLKEKRISKWKEHISFNKGCSIFCFRGGLRSKIAQEWLSENNTTVERISGGYKKVRNKVIEKFQNDEIYNKKWMILGGLTGSGKTILLNKFAHSIDIEGLANHRGSAFGRRNTLQGSCANFENILLFQYLNNNASTILLEDESRTIGKATLPNNWYSKMQASRLVVLDIQMEERIENIFEEYIEEEFRKLNNEILLKKKYLTALEKIKKRLGGELYRKIYIIMEDAFENKSIQNHKEWIYQLLHNYYDPMYNHKLKKRKEYIVHRGDFSSCQDYITSNIH
jgi:tRNA 2-selenouridine synthase